MIISIASIDAELCRSNTTPEISRPITAAEAILLCELWGICFRFIWDIPTNGLLHRLDDDKVDFGQWLEGQTKDDCYLVTSGKSTTIHHLKYDGKVCTAHFRHAFMI